MKKFIRGYILACLIFFLASLVSGVARASTTQKRVELENDIRQRILAITDKIDSRAIVQVRVNLKQVKAVNLPGLFSDVNVTPLDFDGDLGEDSIEAVNVRILTTTGEFPEWVQKELTETVSFGKFKTNIVYEKAAGTIKDTDISNFVREELYNLVNDYVDKMQYGLWALIAGLVVSLAVVAFGIFSFAKRLETSFVKVVAEQIVPAMMQNRGAGGGSRDVGSNKEQKISVDMSGTTGGGGGGGVKELADLPNEALLSLLSDCYWTQSDDYAHYIWIQMTQKQREEVISSGQIDVQYFSYFQHSKPKNRNYHLESKYLMVGRDFVGVNQDDLAKYVRTNRKEAARVTPMRWDLLPLSLKERLEISKDYTNLATLDRKAKDPGVRSKPRNLPMRIQINNMSVEDEQFIWENPDAVPVEARSSIKSLVWFAMAPLEYRKKVMAELDARQLADAWVGPEVVLGFLKEALPPKKLEMLNHFLKDAAPRRDSEVYEYLTAAGLNVPKEENVSAPSAA